MAQGRGTRFPTHFHPNGSHVPPRQDPAVVAQPETGILRTLDDLAIILEGADRAAWARNLRFEAGRIRDDRSDEAIGALRRYFTEEPRLLSVQIDDAVVQRGFESKVMRLHALLDDAQAQRAWEADPRREVPGKTLGIVGFVLALVGGLNLVGFILSWVALAQSKKAGAKNPLALAGLLIGGAGVLFAVIVLALAAGSFADLFETCGRLGTGVHEVGDAVYTCTPTSAHVSTSPR
ncbi:DUF4190 domain-containing protein [Agromyces sp. NPDC058104]|uniref:DUF4190 domain-containing protein n=1 Tax=Agromyces sp. NPDC058104 TaxID=3346342 RepID=UPI0036DB4E10